MIVRKDLKEAYEMMNRRPAIIVKSCILTLVLCYVSAPQSAMAYKGATSKFFSPDHVEAYKQFEGEDFNLHIFYPNSKVPTEPAPAILMFHGGGFTKGSPGQFFYLNSYFASRGMVCISVRYRIRKGKVGAVMDGRTALRYVRKNAERFGIDEDRIAVGGGSAGGCLAAALSTSTLIHDPTDDMSIPGYPQALVLFNPVYMWKANDGTPEMRENFTPFKNIHKDMAPAIVLFGEKDKYVNPTKANEFKEKMEKVGVRSELEIYPGEKHSFFTKSQSAVIDTLTKVDIFLTSLGWLEGEPTVEQWHGSTKRGKKKRGKGKKGKKKNVEQSDP